MNKEKELIDEIKKTLAKIAENNPVWRLVLGRESLSATEVIGRIDKDKKLRATIIKHYVGLAIELEQQARKKLEEE